MLSATEKRRGKTWTPEPLTHQPEKNVARTAPPPLAPWQLKLEVQQLHSGMIRWCRAHFGEAFSAWMHVKLIKSYVESVMRYGLPVDFSAFMLAVKKGQDAKVGVSCCGHCVFGRGCLSRTVLMVIMAR